MNRYRIVITGIVQGVGFRPFIYNLAKEMGLKGWVGNTDSNVVIEIETHKGGLPPFVERIRENAPVLSRIESLDCIELPYEGFDGFSIKHSESFSKGPVFISPDVSTCEDCLKELKDPGDRRFGYPFINCTNCGPRFTIIKDIPYDRDKTTMDSFEMCGRCRGEYTAPSDRRYHAQPVSCHDCGPVLSIADQNGKDISMGKWTGGQCMEYVTQIIKAGKIAAIKGIGGYHLACDALDGRAVDRLRSRKHRDDKPFALMMKNLEVISKYCNITEKEMELLKSPASPIVLLEKNSVCRLPGAIAHLNRYLGVMLPYNPIHHILFDQEGFPEALVMTSGNLSSEPIFYRDEEAAGGLTGIADAFLTHNREIYIRTDDSVTRAVKGREYIIRRSRGYVPMPVRVDVHRLLNIDVNFNIPSVLACGGELKNVFCLNKGDMFYLSHHIGDLENDSTNRAFTGGVEHFKRLFEIEPGYIAHDLHPGYYSTQYALEQGPDRKTGIQHHKAHIASCMAENGLSGEVIGVSFDGTGYGEDGGIWGGEFFKGGYYGFERAGHLQYVMMPGGDSAVKHPWRMALGYLYSCGMADAAGMNAESRCGNSRRPDGTGCGDKMVLDGINRGDIEFTVGMLDRKLNCPETSSAGRFFDAVSALLGIRTGISYEGQAAIELEYYAVQDGAMPYDVELYRPGGEEGRTKAPFVVKTDTVIKQILRELSQGCGREHISSRFHKTVAEIILRGCQAIRGESGLNRAVLSGGVFQNITLLNSSVELLEQNGFEVYIHSQVPANDGGISLGQAMMALAEIASST